MSLLPLWACRRLREMHARLIGQQLMLNAERFSVLTRASNSLWSPQGAPRCMCPNRVHSAAHASARFERSGLSDDVEPLPCLLWLLACGQLDAARQPRHIWAAPVDEVEAVVIHWVEGRELWSGGPTFEEESCVRLRDCLRVDRFFQNGIVVYAVK